MPNVRTRTPGNAAYELFILAASALAITNVVLITLVRNEVVDSVSRRLWQRAMTAPA